MKFIESVLEALYNRNMVIFKSKRIEDLQEKDRDELNNFHINEIYLITQNDEYFCGMRADHFCIEIGNSENYTDRKIILISANLKAFRMMTMLY